MASKRKAEEQGPEAPKRPQSGYGQFLAEKRAEIGATLLKEGVEKAKIMTASATRAGVMWKALGEAKQKPYNDKSAKLMEEYTKVLEDFKSANPEWKKEKKEKKGKGEDKPPSRPAGAYAQWMAENRPMLTAKVMKEHGVEKQAAFFMLYKEGKPLWEALPAEEKQRFEDQVQEQLVKYKAEQKDWKGKAKAGAEPKRPLGAYPAWISANREMLSAKIMKDHGVDKAKAFLMHYKEGKPVYDALPAAERKKYEDQAEAAKEQFRAEHKEWKEAQKNVAPEATAKAGNEEKPTKKAAQEKKKATAKAGA